MKKVKKKKFSEFVFTNAENFWVRKVTLGFTKFLRINLKNKFIYKLSRCELARHMHPEILKGLSLGLSIQFFEYVSFEYFANLLQISKKII